MTKITPVVVQTHFRGRNDDVALNSTSFTHALNTNWSQAPGVNFRVRFEVEETAGGSGSVAGELEFSHNGGGFAFIGPPGGAQVVTSSLTSQYADGDATTNIIAGSSRTFVAGHGSEDDQVTSVALINQHTEFEHCLQISDAATNPGDTIVIRQEGLNSYTNTLTITVASPGPTTHERSASVDATGAVAAVGTFWSILEAAATVAAVADVISAGVRVGATIERSASVDATGAVESAGTFWSIFDRSSSVDAAGAVTTAGQRDLLRSAAVAATGDVASAGLHEVPRSASLTASGDIATIGQVVGGASTLERSAAIDATADVASSGQRDVLRASEVSATAGVESAGVFWSTLERSSDVAATATVETTGRRDLLRSSAVDATAAVATDSERDLHRAASVDATGAVTAAGLIEGGAVTHERSASLDASAAVASSATFWSVLEGAVAVDATASVASAGIRDLLRSAAVDATGDVAAVGQRDLLRAVAVATTGDIAVAGETRALIERAIVLAATGGVDSAGRITETLERATLLAAIAALETSGASIPAGWPVDTEIRWDFDTDTPWLIAASVLYPSASLFPSESLFPGLALRWTASSEDRWATSVGERW